MYNFSKLRVFVHLIFKDYTPARNFVHPFSILFHTFAVMNDILSSPWLTIALSIIYVVLWVVSLVLFLRKTHKK